MYRTQLRLSAATDYLQALSESQPIHVCQLVTASFYICYV